MATTGTARRRAIGIAALLVLVPLSLPAEAQQTNPDMMYFVQGEKYPRGLSDFQAFGLSRRATRSGAVFSGWVMADRSNPDDSTIEMKTVRVQGQSLSFTTKPRQGTVFAFDGRFLKRGDFQRFYGDAVAVVEGTARKLRGGKTVARARLRFTCGTGG